MVGRWRYRIAAILALLGVTIAAMVSGQTQNKPGTLDDLLTEVRGLRADFAQATNVSIRTQLLTARLQLEEQRIYTIGRQLTDIHNPLTTLREEIADIQRRVQSFEDSLAIGPKDDAQRRAFSDLPAMIRQERSTLDQKQRREQELRTQEAALVELLNTEQARWADFNQRLDSLEQSLPQGPRR